MIPNLSNGFLISWGFLLLSPILFLISSYLDKILNKPKRERRKDVDTYSVLEEPISTEIEDSLGRNVFAEKISREVINLPMKDTFSYGVLGEWGSGKTSLINLIVGVINRDDDAIVMFYNPWFYSNKEAMIEAFYNDLIKTISKEYVTWNVRKSIRSYLKLIKEGVPIFRGVKIDFNNMDFFSSERSLRNKIEKYTQGMNRNIVVIVDDIDRLERNELLEILSLIAYSGKLKNIVFLVAFDYETVVNIIAKNKREKELAKRYLEKIFQRTFAMPDNTTEELIELFELEINKICRNLKYNDKTAIAELNEEFKKIIANTSIFSNMRKVKRFLNSFYSFVSPIIMEINLLDAFRLQILQIEYYSIYQDIKANQPLYLGSWNRNYYYEGTFDRKKYVDRIRNHVDSLLENFDSQGDRSNILKILEGLFWEVGNAYSVGTYYDKSNVMNEFRVEKRISHPECFYKYFIRDLRGEISDAYIEELIESLNNESVSVSKMFSSISFMEENKLKSFFRSLSIRVKKLNDKAKQDLLSELTERIDRFVEEEMYGGSKSEAKFLIYNLLNDLPKKDIKKFAREIILECKDLQFVAEFIYRLEPARGGDYYNIYKAIGNRFELVEAAQKRFNKFFIENDRDIISSYPLHWPFILYQWETLWGTRKVASKELCRYVKKSIDQPKKLLLFLEKRTFGSRIESEEKYIKEESYGCYRDFIFKKIVEFEKDRKLTEKEQKYFNLYKKIYKELQKPKKIDEENGEE
jgi:ABC-type dipeptide/oligopeptide/nickel transport system ATPase subunit